MRHKHADKIMQFAKMVDAGYPIDDLVQTKTSEGWKGLTVTGWNDICEYRVAIGFVEGKPVFEGDVLYDVDGARITATIVDGHKFISRCTWTPPKTREQQLEGALRYMIQPPPCFRDEFYSKMEEFRKLLEKK